MIKKRRLPREDGVFVCLPGSPGTAAGAEFVRGSGAWARVVKPGLTPTKLELFSARRSGSVP